jgi:hypothetical protein
MRYFWAIILLTMGTRKAADLPKQSNKIRFVLLEADLSDDNFTELTHAITQALRPHPAPARTLGNGNKPPAQLTTTTSPAGEEEAEEPIEAEYEQEPASQDAAPKKPSRPKKSKPPTYLHELIKDEDSLKQFAAEKKPSSKAKQYLTAMYWLKEHNVTPTANMDMIYTFYKTAGWSVNFNDWNQPFHNLLFDDLIRKGTAKGEYAINPTGEAVVKSLPE